MRAIVVKMMIYIHIMKSMCACLFAPKVIRPRPSEVQVDHDGDDFERLRLYKSTCDKKLEQTNKIIEKLRFMPGSSILINLISSSSLGERELSAAGGEGDDHEGEHLQQGHVGGEDTKVHYINTNTHGIQTEWQKYNIYLKMKDT